MTPLIFVYIAAIVTTVSGLVYSLASGIWSRVCVRRWDAGINQ